MPISSHTRMGRPIRNLRIWERLSSPKLMWRLKLINFLCHVISVCILPLGVVMFTSLYAPDVTDIQFVNRQAPDAKA